LHIFSYPFCAFLIFLLYTIKSHLAGIIHIPQLQLSCVVHAKRQRVNVQIEHH
jgi:hypothetical protein